MNKIINFISSRTNCVQNTHWFVYRRSAQIAKVLGILFGTFWPNVMYLNPVRQLCKRMPFSPLPVCLSNILLNEMQIRKHHTIPAAFVAVVVFD